MLVVALTALKIARMTASHEERVFLLTVQSRRRVSAEIIRSDDPTVSRIIVFGFLSPVPFPQGSSYVETWLPWDWGTSGRD